MTTSALVSVYIWNEYIAIQVFIIPYKVLQSSNISGLIFFQGLDLMLVVLLIQTWETKMEIEP